MFRTKRVYDPPAEEDGFRVLVDRLWPRGLSKARAEVHAWPKEIAPSTELRKWFQHEDPLWEEFRLRYLEELKTAERVAALEQLRREAQARGTVTLLFGARNEAHNHAVLLCELLNGTGGDR